MRLIFLHAAAAQGAGVRQRNFLNTKNAEPSVHPQERISYQRHAVQTRTPHVEFCFLLRLLRCRRSELQV